MVHKWSSTIWHWGSRGDRFSPELCSWLSVSNFTISLFHLQLLLLRNENSSHYHTFLKQMRLVSTGTALWHKSYDSDLSPTVLPQGEKKRVIFVLFMLYINFYVFLFVLLIHKSITDDPTHACMKICLAAVWECVVSSFAESAWNTPHSFDALLAGGIEPVLGQQRVRGGRRPEKKFWKWPDVSTFPHRLCCSALGIVKWKRRTWSRWVR